MEQEKLAVNMDFSLGFSTDLRTIYQTLDILKIMMVYAWEKQGYGSYKDFFHGKELETKYLSIIQYPNEAIVNDFKKYLKQFHVRTIFDDNAKALEWSHRNMAIVFVSFLSQEVRLIFLLANKAIWQLVMSSI